MTKLFPATLLLSLGCVLAPHASGQSQTLLFEDFEDGIAGWTDDGFPGVWHAAADGECGAVSTMAACNLGPIACDYQAAYPSSATFLRLNRHMVLLPQQTTYILDFDYIRGVDATDDLTTVWLGEESKGFWMPLAGWINGDLANTATLAHHTDSFAPGEFWWGQGVTFELELQVDKLGNQGIGWLVDNVRVSTNAFAKLHGAKGNPEPKLEGIGALRAGVGLNNLKLTDAEPAAGARLVIGFAALNAAYKGGVLVPDPVFAIPFTTDATGSVSLDFVLPPDLEPGLSLYLQMWITDLDETFRLAASNALLAITS